MVGVALFFAVDQAVLGEAIVCEFVVDGAKWSKVVVVFVFCVAVWMVEDVGRAIAILVGAAIASLSFLCDADISRDFCILCDATVGSLFLSCDFAMFFLCVTFLTGQTFFFC